MFYITTNIKRAYTWEYGISISQGWGVGGGRGLMFANEVKVTNKNITEVCSLGLCVHKHYDGCGLSFRHQGLVKHTKTVWQF